MASAVDCTNEARCRNTVLCCIDDTVLICTIVRNLNKRHRSIMALDLNKAHHAATGIIPGTVL